MKKVLAALLALILVMSSMTLVVHAESVDLSDSGEDTDLAETGVGSVESAISWAISIANDDSHGYSQRRRTGPDYDCSSFVSTAFKQAGFALDGTENTGTMKNAFAKAGFTWIPASSIADYPAKSTNLKRGDVLLGSGHTALYIGNDKIVHAINGTYDKYDDGHPGDQTGNEIAVKPFSSSSYSRVGGWLGVLRYGGSEAIDLGSKFYANIVPTATDIKGIVGTGVNVDLSCEGSSSVPNSVYKAQLQSFTCTLAAATNMIRARLYLSNNNSYSKFTENDVGEVGWINGTGLAGSFTFKYDGNSVSITNSGLNGITVSSLKSLLDKHPEGIELYCGGVPHAVLVTDYSGDTFYCVDSDYGRATIRRTLTSSLLGDRLGSQANILKAATKYWYISSYSITPNQNYQNLGDKFYANIVPTGAGSLAVTANGANTNGTNVSLATLDYSDSQKWLFERKDGNAYKITNVQKNKCLDVDNYGTANGTNIQLWSSNDSTAQRWYIVKNGAGYRLVPKCTPGSCLDITGGKLTAGTNIEEWTQNDSPAQRFNIIKTVDHKDIGTNFYANIFVTDDQSLSVTVAEDDNVYIDKTTYEDNQKWFFERQNDKTYKITSIKSGWCLDLYGNKGDLNTNVHTHNDNGNNAQRWYIVTNGSGYTFVPKSYIDKAIDINGGKLLAGTNLKEYTANQTAAQRFTISKTVNHKDIGERFYANIVSNDPAYSITAGTDGNVSLQITDNSDSQKWLFERQSDKTYRITNVQEEKCLDVNGGYTDNGTNIKVYTSNNSNAQKWYIITNNDGYSLVPKCNINASLDVDGAIFETGRNIQEWVTKLNNAQRVFINKTTITPKPEVIELSESELEMEVDETRLLLAQVKPADAEQTVIWSSDNESVATVDENGFVTALSTGTAWISVRTANGLMTRCEVTVTEPTVLPEYVELDSYFASIGIDKTEQLTATVFPEGADQKVIWYSDNEEIASVDENGLITAISCGETTIWAQSYDGTYTAGCTVYVYEPYVEPEHIEWNGFMGTVNDDGTISIYDYVGDSESVSIPSSIEGVTVTDVYGFENNDHIKSIEIPGTIKQIWSYSFDNCQNLHSVIIYGAEFIGNFAFCNCPNLSDVTLSTGVKEIHAGAFTDCSELKLITVPKSVELITGDAFGFVYVPSEEEGVYNPTPIDGFTIYGYKNSVAEDYANNNNFIFVDLEAEHSSEAPTDNTTNPPTLPPTEYSGTKILGDTDGDGSVTIFDATVIQRHLAELSTKVYIEEVADADGDGVISILDATAIQRYLAELTTYEGIDKPIIV